MLLLSTLLFRLFLSQKRLHAWLAITNGCSKRKKKCQKTGKTGRMKDEKGVRDNNRRERRTETLSMYSRPGWTRVCAEKARLPCLQSPETNVRIKNGRRGANHGTQSYFHGRWALYCCACSKVRKNAKAIIRWRSVTAPMRTKCWETQREKKRPEIIWEKQQ